MNLKLLFRKIKNNKTFTVINIIGLTIGLVFAILAFLYGQNELKWDKHFTNTNNAYLLALDNGRTKNSPHAGQPAVFSAFLTQELPKITASPRRYYSVANMRISNNRFHENSLLFANSNFFSFLGCLAWFAVYLKINNSISIP